MADSELTCRQVVSDGAHDESMIDFMYVILVVKVELERDFSPPQADRDITKPTVTHPESSNKKSV